MRKIIAIFFVIGMSGLGLQAQTLAPDVYANPDAQLDLYQAGSKNATYLTQQGDANITNIKQVGNQPSTPNLVRALQQGNSNELSLYTDGGNLRTDAFQNGNSNVFNSVVVGQGNASIVVQNGNNNFITQELRNASGIRTEFTQNGDSNYIQQSIQGVQNQAFKLTQTGNGLRAVIVLTGL
jgi:hypothetical protein